MQTSSKIFSLEVFNKEMKEKNTELQGKINSLVIENTNLKSKIASSTHQFEEAQSQLLCYKEKLCKTDNKYKTAIKKNGGLRSVITKSLPALSAPPKNVCSASPKSVATLTDINDINTDLIQVSEKCQQNDNVLNGKLFYRNTNKYKQNTSGKNSTYIKIPPKNNSSKVMTFIDAI